VFLLFFACNELGTTTQGAVFTVPDGVFNKMLVIRLL